MFRSKDPYRKLHARRRRRRNRTPALALLVVVAAAAAAAVYRPAPGATATPTLSITRRPSPVVALLTAQDAVVNANDLAELALEELAVDPREDGPQTHWSAGRAVSLTGELQRHESLAVALGRRDVPAASAHRAITALAEVVDFRRSNVGDPWEVDVDAHRVVTRLRYAAAPTAVWEARLEGDAYGRHRVELDTQRRRDTARGTVQASLWNAFERAGATPNLAVAFADIFAYTIDFTTETQAGDEFAAVFESTWLDGRRVSTGRILAAHYAGAHGAHWAFRWKDAYYDEHGESVERQFLRSPLATVRVTSNYGRRFHPVLQTMKMHAGVDYGAPTGTPVQAVADGRVTFAGWKGANGQLIAIEHAGGYTTYYAHLSHIAPKVRAGTRVKKKQVIGKVGSTGRSTGPHLHFGMKRGGAFINPLDVDFERGAPLGRAERAEFLAAIAPLREELAAHRPPGERPSVTRSFPP